MKAEATMELFREETKVLYATFNLEKGSTFYRVYHSLPSGNLEFKTDDFIAAAKVYMNPKMLKHVQENPNTYERILRATAASGSGHIRTDGDEFLVDTDELAESLADVLDAFGYVTSTGYYDPEEDARDGTEDNLTGWHYVIV